MLVPATTVLTTINRLNFSRKINLTASSFLLQNNQHSAMKEYKHLAQGSSHPPLQPGVLRIYNMRFCPYAQRSLLVAEAKKIPFDVINVNLFHKPDWFLALNPRGQVPTLELASGQSLSESSVVSEYLEERYPSPRPMYPSDLVLRARDRMLIERFNGVIALFYQLFKWIGGADQSIEQVFDKMLRILGKYEKELHNRGTTYFGGNTPGMVDYMIWPWFEREGILTQSGNDKLNIFNNNRLPALKRWCDMMKTDDGVKKWLLPAEIHAQFLMGLFARQPDYDFLVVNNKL